MKVGRVVGSVVGTINDSFFEGKRLLVCDVLGRDQTADGYTIAVDVVGAGPGETVLILDEGSSARQIFGVSVGPIRAVVVAIVDHVSWG